MKYIEPSHRKLYGEVIRLKQARIRRRLVTPYQAYGFSTGKKTPYNLSTNVDTKGKLISKVFPSYFQTFKSPSLKRQYSVSILLALQNSLLS